MDSTADHIPLAHCWKDEPPMQFHIPSVEQAVPTAKAVSVTVVPVLEEPAAEATELALGEAAEVATAGIVELAFADDATVAKTPPGTDDAEDLAELTAAALVWLPDEPAVTDADADDPAPAAWHEPVGLERAVDVEAPSCSTEPPGFGNRRSVESTVPQPFPMLATNMSGSALKAAVSRSSISLRLEEDEVMLIGAQFMYISLFPILLNQVQARVAFPVGRVDGRVKL